MFPVSLGFIILIKQDFLWLIFSLSLIIFIHSYVRWNAYRCFPSVLHFSCCSNLSHCLILLDCGTQSPMSPRHVRNALAYSFLEKYPPPLSGNKSFSFPSFHYVHLALVIALTLFVVLNPINCSSFFSQRWTVHPV